MNALSWIALAGFLAAKPPQRQVASERSAMENSLRGFLQTYLRTPPWTEIEPTTRYLPAFVDLDGDGKPEAIVYITGRWWCGSGGCVTLILHREGSSYRVVTRITISRPPIRVFAATSHGWRNISVWVAGGGILQGYQADLRFDGTTYPSNPTTPPARPLEADTRGQIVISASRQGALLYP